MTTPGPMTTATVVLTVAGDAGSIEVEADTTLAVGAMVPAWAARVSSAPPEDLVVVSADNQSLVDPDETLEGIGAGYGTVLRLVTTDEAMGLLGVTPLDLVAADLASHQPEEPAVDLREPPCDPASGDRVAEPPPPCFNVGRPATLGAPPAGEGPMETSGFPRGRPDSMPARSAGGAGAASPGKPIAARPTTPDSRAAVQGLLPARVSKAGRWGRSLRAVLSAKTLGAPPPASDFAKAAVPGPAERWRLARAGADRVHNLEAMIRHAPLERCVVIAVVSPKGGAGKTSLTALLASLFAELRRDPVLALDANPDFGNLADKMGAPVSHVDTLASWLAEHPTATPAELAARLGRGPHGVRFLPTPVGDLDRMIATADVTLYQDLLTRLRDYEGIIVVDCGTGLLDPPVRAALDTADQVIMVTDSSADTAGLVVSATSYLREGTPLWLAVNKMPAKGSNLDLARVQGAIPGLRGMTVVPEVRLAENLITPAFDWAGAPRAWVEPVRELAARLAAAWAGLP